MKTGLDGDIQWLALAENAKWTVGKLARLRGVSVRTLERHFIENKGLKPKQWLTQQRQQRAVELLRSGYSVKETAQQVEYASPGTFSREFTKHWGFSPICAKKNHNMNPQKLST